MGYIIFHIYPSALILSSVPSSFGDFAILVDHIDIARAQTDLYVGIQKRSLGGEAFRICNVVSIHSRYQSTSGDGQSPIQRLCDAYVPFVRQKSDASVCPGKRPDGFYSFCVIRIVTYDDEFEIPEGLILNGTDRCKNPS